jgi:hypothetical protein
VSQGGRLLPLLPLLRRLLLLLLLLLLLPSASPLEALWGLDTG